MAFNKKCGGAVSQTVFGSDDVINTRALISELNFGDYRSAALYIITTSALRLLALRELLFTLTCTRAFGPW